MNQVMSGTLRDLAHEHFVRKLINKRSSSRSTAVRTWIIIKGCHAIFDKLF